MPERAEPSPLSEIDSWDLELEASAPLTQAGEIPVGTPPPTQQAGSKVKRNKLDEWRLLQNAKRVASDNVKLENPPLEQRISVTQAATSSFPTVGNLKHKRKRLDAWQATQKHQQGTVQSAPFACESGLKLVNENLAVPSQSPAGQAERSDKSVEVSEFEARLDELGLDWDFEEEASAPLISGGDLTESQSPSPKPSLTKVFSTVSSHSTPTALHEHTSPTDQEEDSVSEPATPQIQEYEERNRGTFEQLIPENGLEKVALNEVKMADPRESLTTTSSVHALQVKPTRQLLPWIKPQKIARMLIIEEQSSRLMLHFLWRWMLIAGLVTSVLWGGNAY